MSDAWIAADWPAPDGLVAGTTHRGFGDAPLPAAGKPFWLRQVHGAAVADVRTAGDTPQADAAFAPIDAGVCVVQTADCLPVTFCSKDGRWIASAHAGWRGLAAGVLENTVAAMPVAPAELLAWFGPAISQPAFEVGDDVRDAFVRHDASHAAAFDRNHCGRWQADLYRLARWRLAAAGVDAVFGGGLCSYRDADRFYSYRRDPGCGRMLTFVGRKIAG